jgi:hypothetical protein
MVTLLVIGCFVGMLLAPCVIAVRANKSKTKSANLNMDDAADKLSILEENPSKRTSSQMRTVRIQWNSRFDPDEFPRSPRRIVPIRRR